MSLLSHDWYTIEPCPSGSGYAVYAHGYYGRSSVLAGSYGRAYQMHYDDVESAQADYPQAEVMEGSTKDAVDPDPGPIAPSWFDPAAAGERWDSDY